MPSRRSTLVPPPLGQRVSHSRGHPLHESPLLLEGLFQSFVSRLLVILGEPDKNIHGLRPPLNLFLQPNPFHLSVSDVPPPFTCVPSPPRSQSPGSAPLSVIRSPGPQSRCSWSAPGSSLRPVPSPEGPVSVPVSAGTSLPPPHHQNTMSE